MSSAAEYAFAPGGCGNQPWGKHDHCEMDTLSEFSVMTWSTTPVSEPLTLSWRMNSMTSFSDWTIEIRVLDKKSRIDTYHVHRPMLAAGCRKSGYFEHLFHDRRNLTGSNASVTQLEFPERVANQFPAFLDFLYWSDMFELETDTAIILGYLAQCLSVPSLYREVVAFVRRDLSLSNMGSYMAEAINFKDDDTAARVLDLCLQEFIDGCTTSPLRTRVLPYATDDTRRRLQKVLHFLIHCPSHVVERIKDKSPRLPYHDIVDLVTIKVPRFPGRVVARIKKKSTLF
jgi:hypothetical protein